MFPKTYQFFLEERNAIKGNQQTEWCLLFSFDGGDRWVIESWDKKPKYETVERIKDYVIQGIHVYTRSFTLPDTYLTDKSL